MDSASISPLLVNSPNYFKDSFEKRVLLKTKLNQAYDLNDFYIFFIPSVRIGILLFRAFLSTSDFKFKTLANYIPIEKSLNLHFNKEYKLATHVDPYYGKKYKLNYSEKNCVIDASHSFATNLHYELIENANIFLAPLHKHASVVIGLSILCIRKNHEIINKQNMGYLNNIESYTFSNDLYDSALKVVELKEWLPFNTASICPKDINISSDIIEITSDDELPFLCFKILDNRYIHDNYTKFKETNTVRIAYMYRNNFNLKQSFNKDVALKLNQIINS